MGTLRRRVAATDEWLPYARPHVRIEENTMGIRVQTARCIAVLALLLLAGSLSARSVMGQEPTTTVVVDVSTTVPTTAPVVNDGDDDDSVGVWGLLGLFGLLGLAGLLRKPKTEVQTVTRTVAEPPVTRTVVEPPIDRTQP